MNIDPGKQLETVVSPLETAAARVRARDVKSHGVAEYIYYADTVWSMLGAVPGPGTCRGWHNQGQETGGVALVTSGQSSAVS